MQTQKTRSGSKETPPRVSPRGGRQLKPAPLEVDSAFTPAQATRTTPAPRAKSPKVVERRSPRSPVPEKKQPIRISELESQISQLQVDLKKAKDQLSLSESWKKQAQQEAQESKEQLLAMSLKLEESQKQLVELSASEEGRLIELQEISQERDRAWQSELEAVQKQHSVDSAALASAINEIQRLKVQLDIVAESENGQTKHTKRTESSYFELQSLRRNLADSLSLVENMKNQLKDSKESEAHARAVASETLLQLESAKRTVETLRSDGKKSIEAYNSIASELDQSKAQVNLLEGLVTKLQAYHNNGNTSPSQYSGGDIDSGQGIGLNKNASGVKDKLEAELSSSNSEVVRLRAALEAAETKFQEEQIRNEVQIRSAYDLMEQINSESRAKEAHLEELLEKAKADIEELKANLMDKETELQGISEENEGLHLKLEKSPLLQRDSEVEKELRSLRENIADLRANLMDKETELQNILEENEMLKSEIRRWDVDKGVMNNQVVAEVEAARSAEREALMKLGFVMEEVDKSKRKATRVTEQLEAAQAVNSEMEAELRRLKVQSDQWRKAAEAAAAMLSVGNNGKFMERTGSLDPNHNPLTGKIGSPFSEALDDDWMKKKNGNMLKKIGVLWKKPQK